MDMLGSSSLDYREKCFHHDGHEGHDGRLGIFKLALLQHLALNLGFGAAVHSIRRARRVRRGAIPLVLQDELVAIQQRPPDVAERFGGVAFAGGENLVADGELVAVGAAGEGGEVQPLDPLGVC